MAVADSVSVFAEGTFEEQIQELVNYIVRGRPEEERAAFIVPFQDALKTSEGQKPIDQDEERRRKVLSMVLRELKDFGDGTEKEIEGFFNLIYSHFLTLYPPSSPETKQGLETVLKAISSAPSEQSFIKYRVLSNLFNALPRTSRLRLSVYRTLLDTATSNDELAFLQLSRADVNHWMEEWEISQEEKSAFLKTIADAYAKFDQLTTSYTYSISYLQSLPSTSAETRNAAIDVIATALCLPSVFDFDALFRIDAVVGCKDEEIFSLLQVFLSGGLTEFKAWEASHPQAFAKYNLERTQLEHKIKLLTLASLGFKNVGQNLPYSSIAEAIQVDKSEVETWVIDIIRAGLLWGKMSQTKQTLHIIRSTARTFEREQWEALEKRLLAWKSGLNNVLEVVANARRQGGVHAPTQTAAASA
ncbi:PCI-domain-containing protein [Marasmius fiardii PR-910]|nr:PCI-domain-containing protein [Marasmius fiardii PR-910]